ncbi:DUF58 domain-containing protein [Faecalicatena sp. AGMB00832]|uniref:DUF58 domain-containing protein n=1 Tax=Faecalicatena faecalis TaxID=2726362 RepID=A0ABS6D925_9FIRM|nr:DUF58 domain-containing protein [Faecalicatena faecalis]MBU3877979.1 DUF58 domain-containing protein [Faecalicatena faecalis]
MKKRIGIYLAVVLATTYLFLMYDEPALTAVLVLECLYPVFSFFYLRWMNKRIAAELYKVPSMGEKHGKIRIRVRVKNSSRVWSARYRVEIRAGSSLFNGRAKGMQVCKRLSGMVESHGIKSQEYILDIPFCGRTSIRLEKLWVYDFLGIFSSRIRLREEAVIGILPAFELMPLEITRRTREFLADADEHSMEKGGDDPAETYRIREYRPMDSVHDIHWKLTAKEGELMVKERGFPLGCVVLIWLDFPEEGMSAEGFDRMLEKAASLCMTLAEEKCIHMAAWFEEKNERVVKYKISNAEDAYELVWRLLDMEPYKNHEMEQIAYEDAFLGDHFSSTIEIDGQGQIKVNGEIQELLQV